MSNTFSKLQKRIENSDGTYTFEPISYVGVDNVPLDIMKPSTESEDGEIGLVPKPPKSKEPLFLSSNGQWSSVSTASLGVGIFNGNSGLVPDANEDTDFRNLVLFDNGKWVEPYMTTQYSGTNQSELYLQTYYEDTAKSSRYAGSKRVRMPEASMTRNGLMSIADKKLLTDINVEVFHAYNSTSVALGSSPGGNVTKVDPSNSSNQYNSSHFILDNFKTYNDNWIGNTEKAFEVVDTDPNGTYGHYYCGLKTLVAGYYRFDLRLLYKLDKAVGHRIEYGPFVNGERISRWFCNYGHNKAYTMIYLQTCLLTLKVGDIVKFGYKLVDDLVEDFSDNTIQPVDTMCTLLRRL